MSGVCMAAGPRPEGFVVKVGAARAEGEEVRLLRHRGLATLQGRHATTGP